MPLKVIRLPEAIIVRDGEDVQAVIRQVIADCIAAGYEIDSVFALHGPADKVKVITDAPNPFVAMPRRSMGTRVVDGVMVFHVNAGSDHPHLHPGACGEHSARAGGWCKWIEVEGQAVQGNLERRYAEALSRRGVEWRAHHRRTFAWLDAQGKSHFYAPDFYLPADQMYVEVKGWLRDIDVDKMTRVREQNPDLRLIMVRERDIREMERAQA